MNYVILGLFITSFVLYSKHQFEDQIVHAKGKWHPYGAVMRYLFVFALFQRWQDIFFGIVISAIAWDILINVISLDATPFYVGKTSTWDKALGQHKWALYVICFIAATYCKFY